jgi:hypothetical protein
VEAVATLLATLDVIDVNMMVDGGWWMMGDAVLVLVSSRNRKRNDIYEKRDLDIILYNEHATWPLP